MKKKKIKALRFLAERLPESYTVEMVGRKKLGEALTGEEINRLTDNGISVNAGQMYRFAEPQLTKIEHSRRLKRAYADKGEAGIIEYLTWLQLNNRRVAKILKKDYTEDALILKLIKAGAGKFWSVLLMFFYSFARTFGREGAKATA